MEGSCMELGLEGERLCKAGDCRHGVKYFEAAIKVGTDDLKTLSAIYSQLGNAYFYLQEYTNALEYHKHDLNLARTLGDKLGEAKASGNLGNTLKVLEKFEEALVCCRRHLELSRELSDRVGEARALYNIGSVYHAKGKTDGQGEHQLYDPENFPTEIRECLLNATKYYNMNLEIVNELSDRAAQGRAYGNLGNVHYLLGDFLQAIKFHEERLAIAKEFGDRSAERRARSNLGNAHIFLGQFEIAAEQYKLTLEIACLIGDRALEAQACYSLGNTYTLLQDYQLAIEYHLRHLQIAQELKDRVGEARACWSLGNAHTALSSYREALSYATKHLNLSKEIGDQAGQITAQMNLTDLQSKLDFSETLPSDNTSSLSTERSGVNSLHSNEHSGVEEADAGAQRPDKDRRSSMDQLRLIKLTPDKSVDSTGVRPKVPRVHKSASILSNIQSQENLPKTSQLKKSKSVGDRKDSNINERNEEDDFLDLLSRFQSRRIDEQRCSFRVLNDNVAPSQPNKLEPSKPSCAVNTDSPFLDMVAGIQGARMNDQRASLPSFPGLHSSPQVINRINNSVRANADNQTQSIDESFYDMLMKCQGSRIDGQRSSLPAKAPTVPDEDFFSLISRVQSNRIDTQRADLRQERPAAVVEPTDEVRPVVKPKRDSYKKKLSFKK